MQELQFRNDIVIIDAGKGGAVVILDVEDYVKEAERQLKNKEQYRKITTNLLLLIMKLSTKLYQDFKKKTYKVRIPLRDLKQKTPRHLIYT